MEEDGSILAGVERERPEAGRGRKSDCGREPDGANFKGHRRKFLRAYVFSVAF